jgi:hypothetical protein
MFFTGTKTDLAQLMKNLSIFTQKKTGIKDLEKKTYSASRIRIQESKKLGIPNPDPQH